MVEKNKIDFGNSSYLMGVFSIIFGVLSPLVGIVVGIVGLVFANKEKTTITKKAKKLNLIGIILGLVILALSIVATLVLGLNGLQTFPTN
jgi:hypothetical protein